MKQALVIERHERFSMIDTKYENLLDKVADEGSYRPDRTGVGASALPGQSLDYYMVNGLPVVTTKRVHLKSVIGELLWFLSGSQDKNVLRDEYGVTIWDEWDAPNPGFPGDLGPVYGSQWRHGRWTDVDGNVREIDQIMNVIDGINTDPFGRRHIVNSWNVGQIKDMALPPCHMMFQFFVHSNRIGAPTGLSLTLYQRSADMFLGVPFNITSYAILLAMVAQEVGLQPKHLYMHFGDAHVYENHRVAVATQLERVPQAFHFPSLVLEEVNSIFDHTPDTIHINGYEHHPAISAEVAI